VQADISPDAIYYRFFLLLKFKLLSDHTFECMAARLCAMEQNASSTTSDPAIYAEITISSSSLSTPSSPMLSRMDTCPSSNSVATMSLVPSSSVSSLLPCDLPATYNKNKSNSSYLRIEAIQPHIQSSYRIFDLYHSTNLVAIGYSTYLADPCKFLWRYKDDSRLVVILNIHVDDGAAVLTCRGSWDETVFKLNKRYPGILDKSTMDSTLIPTRGHHGSHPQYRPQLTSRALPTSVHLLYHGKKVGKIRS